MKKYVWVVLVSVFLIALAIGVPALQVNFSHANSAHTSSSADEWRWGDTRGWTTDKTKILTPTGSQYIISGINWYGFETVTEVAHGLNKSDIVAILDLVKRYGYNTIRIPFSSQMWESNPVPQTATACPSCVGLHSRDILAKIVNYAGSIGLHIILDNHRSEAGNSTEANGLWYTAQYPEENWINDWVSMQRWVHGIPQSLGATDTIKVKYLASDHLPTVMGYDLRNEPHALKGITGYTVGAQWGSGDGIDPQVDPNPNPFSPSCATNSSCHDWRLAAERAGDTILGDAADHHWSNPLIFVEGISNYPTAAGTQLNGPYAGVWYGANLQGVNGNSSNAGAPIVLNAGGDSQYLGRAVNKQIVYSAHDYSLSVFKQPWFNSMTCYKSGCSTSSLVDLWTKFWAYIAIPHGINPTWPGHESYPWHNTGAEPYTSAPMWLGEFGTGKTVAALASTGAGTQGQWFTDIVNFVKGSYNGSNPSSAGVDVRNLNWTYWALNGEDKSALLTRAFNDLVIPQKEYTYLCSIQKGHLALDKGIASGQCGSTGPLPSPR